MATQSKMLVSIFAIALLCLDPASAADPPKGPAREDRSVTERILEAAHNLGKKIDQAVARAQKQFEEQRTGERLREKIKNAAARTGEELERIGKEIEDKFSK